MGGALPRVSRDEVENQTVLTLTISVNPPQIPRDVVIEQDVADLEVDALARGFSRNQDLNGLLPELLLGM